MVRNIVGSLIQVGCGNRPQTWVGELLVSRNHELAAPTFSPDGLYLAKVDYDARWGLPQEQDRASMLPFELPFN
jgi:tRNA pseudouridine38-40 synthase